MAALGYSTLCIILLTLCLRETLAEQNGTNKTLGLSSQEDNSNSTSVSRENMTTTFSPMTMASNEKNNEQMGGKQTQHRNASEILTNHTQKNVSSNEQPSAEKNVNQEVKKTNETNNEPTRTIERMKGEKVTPSATMKSDTVQNMAKTTTELSTTTKISKEVPETMNTTTVMTTLSQQNEVATPMNSTVVQSNNTAVLMDATVSQTETSSPLMPISFTITPQSTVATTQRSTTKPTSFSTTTQSSTTTSINSTVTTQSSTVTPTSSTVTTKSSTVTPTSSTVTTQSSTVTPTSSIVPTQSSSTASTSSTATTQSSTLTSTITAVKTESSTVTPMSTSPFPITASITHFINSTLAVKNYTSTASKGVPNVTNRTVDNAMNNNDKQYNLTDTNKNTTTPMGWKPTHIMEITTMSTMTGNSSEISKTTGFRNGSKFDETGTGNFTSPFTFKPIGTSPEGKMNVSLETNTTKITTFPPATTIVLPQGKTTEKIPISKVSPSFQNTTQTIVDQMNTDVPISGNATTTISLQDRVTIKNDNETNQQPVDVGGEKNVLTSSPTVQTTKKQQILTTKPTSLIPITVMFTTTKPTYKRRTTTMVPGWNKTHAPSTAYTHAFIKTTTGPKITQPPTSRPVTRLRPSTKRITHYPSTKTVTTGFQITSVVVESDTTGYGKRSSPPLPDKTDFTTAYPTTGKLQPHLTTLFKTNPKPSTTYWQRSTEKFSPKFPSDITTEMVPLISQSTTQLPTLETPVNAVYSIKYTGDCKPIMNHKDFRYEFEQKLIKTFVDKVGVPEGNVILEDISCGSVNVTATLEGVIQSKVNNRLDEVVRQQHPIIIESDGKRGVYIPESYVRLEKAPRLDDTKTVPSTARRGLSSSEVTVIIVVCVLGFILIIVVIGLLVHECRKRSHTKSFDLRGTPRPNTTPDDFTLTKMKRGEPNYDEFGIVINPSGVNGDINSKSEQIPPQKGIDNPTYGFVEAEAQGSPNISLLKNRGSSVDTGIENPSFSSEDMLDSGTEMDRENSSLIGVNAQGTLDTFSGSDSGRQSDSTAEVPSPELESSASHSPQPGSNLSLNDEESGTYEPFQFVGGNISPTNREAMLPIKEEVVYQLDSLKEDNNFANNTYEMVERNTRGSRDSEYVVPTSEGATAF